MNGNSLMVVGQPNRFARQSVQVARPNPASPMVLQRFMQLLTDLNHKVDTLATRPPQVIQVKPVESRPVEVKPPAKSAAKAPEEKVDRKEMRTMFD